MLDHMLSIHVRSRVFATLEDAAQFIKSVSMLYDAYVETKNINKLKVKRFLTAALSFASLACKAHCPRASQGPYICSRRNTQDSISEWEAHITEVCCSLH